VYPGDVISTGRGIASAACGLALFVAARAAAAQETCPVIDGGAPALAAEDATARLAFVRRLMHDQARYAHTWTVAWSGIGFGLAAGQYGLAALATEPSKRQENVVAGTVSFYLPASIAVLPLSARSDADELETRVALAWTNQGVMSPCLALARAEELLQHTADDEAAHASIFQHALTITLSAGYGAVLWVLFHDVGGLLLNGIGAVVIGEAQIFTVPTGAVSGLARYRSGDLGASTPPKVTWSLAPLGVGQGLSVVGTF
jgi:hypothetical protein